MNLISELQRRLYTPFIVAFFSLNRWYIEETRSSQIKKFHTLFQTAYQLCLNLAEFCFCFADEINKTKAS